MTANTSFKVGTLTAVAILAGANAAMMKGDITSGFEADARTYTGQAVFLCKEAFDAGKIAPAAPNKFGKMKNGETYVVTINEGTPNDRAFGCTQSTDGNVVVTRELTPTEKLGEAYGRTGLRSVVITSFKI